MKVKIEISIEKIFVKKGEKIYLIYIMARQVIVRRMSTNSAHTESKSLNYCINLLQKRAYEQYIATLLLPPKIRRCGFAIRAFNIEISSIRDQVMKFK